MDHNKTVFMDFLSINLDVEGKNFMKCKYMQLDPIAPNTGRRFIFSDIQEKNEIITYDSVINIYVNIRRWNSQNDHLIQFDLVVLDFYELPNGEFCIYGHPEKLGIIEYRQGVLDIFYNWQKSVSFDWFSAPAQSDLRQDYILACMRYSGLPQKILDKNLFVFDLSMIEVERDLYYLIGLEFVGDRAYFGHDFHTFSDCLIELYNHNGYFEGRRIKFINSIRPNNNELKSLVEKIKELFIGYKFSIV